MISLQEGKYIEVIRILKKPTLLIRFYGYRCKWSWIVNFVCWITWNNAQSLCTLCLRIYLLFALISDKHVGRGCITNIIPRIPFNIYPAGSAVKLWSSEGSLRQGVPLKMEIKWWHRDRLPNSIRNKPTKERLNSTVNKVENRHDGLMKARNFVNAKKTLKLLSIES